MVKEPPPRLPSPRPTVATNSTSTMSKKPITIQQQQHIRRHNTSPCRGRNQRQIRHDLYQKLGLLGHHRTTKRSPSDLSASSSATSSTSSSSSSSSCSSSLPSCFNKRPKGPLHASEEKPRVTFYEQVVVRNIPSHRDYDEETWNRLYTDPKIVAQEMKRNKYEFWVDDNNWRRATEEDEFFQAADGSLVHPASWSLMSNLKHQYRVTFQQGSSSYGNDFDHDNDDDSITDEEEHEEEDPTSVMEVDGPRSRRYQSRYCYNNNRRKCPYKNDGYRYGHPQHGGMPYQSRYYRSNDAQVTARRRASIYVNPVHA